MIINYTFLIKNIYGNNSRLIWLLCEFLFLAIFGTFYLNGFCHENVLNYPMNKDSNCLISIIVLLNITCLGFEGFLLWEF